MIEKKLKLSKRSQEFLENLRIYLFASGKKEAEINEILEELEDHLTEAEIEGKSIEKIIGHSPKEYMEQLSTEMPFDFKGWMKYIPILIIGVFSYFIMGDAIRGEFSFTWFEIISFPVVCLILLLVYMSFFKYLAGKKLSKVKEYVLFYCIGLVSFGLFFALMFIDKHFETPTVQFGSTGNAIALIFSILVFIGIALWSKTWFTIIIPIVLFLPEFLLSLTQLQEETKLILSSLGMFVGFGIYFIVIMKIEKNKSKI